MIIDNTRGTITKISRKARISIFLMACILLPMLVAIQLVCTVELKEPVEAVSVILLVPGSLFKPLDFSERL